MATSLLDLLLPQRCLVCRSPGSQVCEHCLDALPPIRAPLCERCGAPTAWPVARCSECTGRRLAFARARAAVVYNGAVKTIVAAWKERGLRGLARMAGRLVAGTLPRPEGVTLTFVPPDGERSLSRGHHPAERLARELGEHWDLRVEPMLGRARSVPRQRGLRLADRRRNVRGAFTPLGRAPPVVILIDDIYTSGATAAAAASALRQAGARRVEVVTFARAVR
jgi:predicted amidophosphoribosyltransferase